MGAYAHDMISFCRPQGQGSLARGKWGAQGLPRRVTGQQTPAWRAGSEDGDASGEEGEEEESAGLRLVREGRGARLATAAALAAAGDGDGVGGGGRAGLARGRDQQGSAR